MTLLRSNPPRSIALLLRRSLNRVAFHIHASYAQKPLPPLPALDPSSYTENFVKGSGPGGQKINKTSSAVQLLHHPTGIVVKCQATRSREQNRKLARRTLQEKIEELEKGEEARTVVKARREAQKKRSGEKKRRRKYRALDEEKKAAAHSEEEGVEKEREPDRGANGSQREEYEAVSNLNAPSGEGKQGNG